MRHQYWIRYTPATDSSNPDKRGINGIYEGEFQTHGENLHALKIHLDELNGEGKYQLNAFNYLPPLKGQ